MNNTSQIVHGGGWKESRVENVKVKAWLTLFAAILLGSVAVASDLPWLYIPAAISLVIAVALFLLEKPRAIETPGVHEGGDLTKLYGTVEKTGR